MTRPRERAARAGLELVCRCDPSFPDLLRELPSAPAVLHVSCAAARFADLVADLPAAIVGARRASDYGLEIAGMLARGASTDGDDDSEQNVSYTREGQAYKSAMPQRR